MTRPESRPPNPATTDAVDCAGQDSQHSAPRQAMLYEAAYTWLVLGSTLDVLLTGVILYGLRGIEANPVASVFIEHWGLVGASLFKFAMVGIAIILCENIGRMKHVTGARLSWAMAVISFIPVCWSLLLLYGTITASVFTTGG